MLFYIPLRKSPIFVGIKPRKNAYILEKWVYASEKQALISLQTTCRFEKVTCCFTSNDVSFWKSDVLFLFERRVVLLVVKHLGWRGKKGGRSACCDTCDSKKRKTLVGCARVYTRGKDTYSIFVFDTVLSEPKEGSPLASCKATKTSKSRLYDVVL